MRLVFVLVLISCGPTSRPAGVEPPHVEPVTKAEPPPKPADCEPSAPDQRPPLVFAERSITEGARVAAVAENEWRVSESVELGHTDRDEYQHKAVNGAIQALAADPYNVKATYLLAAAYAEIGALQCSANMLVRLAQLHRMASLKDEVDLRFDKLLARKKTVLDPDFSALRGDDGFRELVRAILTGNAPTIAPTVKRGEPTLDVKHPVEWPQVPQVDDAPLPKKAPARPETNRLQLKVLEVKSSGAGISLKIDCSANRLSVGARGVIVASKGAVSGGSVAVSAVRGTECTATSPLALAAYPQGAAVVFEVPVVE